MVLILLAIIVGAISIYLGWRADQKDKKLDEEMAQIRREIAARD
jgi:hypothetical protein